VRQFARRRSRTAGEEGTLPRPGQLPAGGVARWDRRCSAMRIATSPAVSRTPPITVSEQRLAQALQRAVVHVRQLVEEATELPQSQRGRRSARRRSVGHEAHRAAKVARRDHLDLQAPGQRRAELTLEPDASAALDPVFGDRRQPNDPRRLQPSSHGAAGQDRLAVCQGCAVEAHTERRGVRLVAPAPAGNLHQGSAHAGLPSVVEAVSHLARHRTTAPRSTPQRRVSRLVI
jgi:hypothetical protein